MSGAAMWWKRHCVGLPRGARDRKFVVLAGGEEAIFQRCKPLLKAIGQRVKYWGGPLRPRFYVRMRSTARAALRK